MAEKKDWEKLSPYRHARLRTEMYLGSRDPHVQTVISYDADGAPIPVETTWVPAVFTAFREVFDNALDEVVTHGNGNTIHILFDPKTFEIQISDNGRGIPINFDTTEGKHAATVLLSETMAGRNFADDRGQTRGLNGVGAAVVNFCSAFFDLKVEREGKIFEQRFREGDELVIEDPIIVPKNDRLSGTTVRFKLSPKVFSNLLLPEQFVRDRVYETALCYPTLRLTFNGKRVTAAKTVEKSLFPNHKPISLDITEGTFSSRFWLVPLFFSDGSEHTHSLVNAIPVFDGGTHIDTFKRSFFSGMLTALESQSKKRRLQPNRSDIADGMLLFNLTQVDAPNFNSQSKTRLINEEVGAIIRRAMDDPDFYKSVIRRYPDWIEDIYRRCAERTQKKDDAEATKLAKKNLRQKIEDLEDAVGHDRSKCILFLGEGRSAVAGMAEARDPSLHGGLPLRGKILNVHPSQRVSTKEVLENEALAKVMKSIGLVPGERVNRHILRYGKVYITTDADEDGKNIAALLINFFYQMWPDLFDKDKPPFIHVFDTPLIIAVKGKTRRYWYNEDHHEFDPDAFKGWEITRAKGLAALKKDDWKYVLVNPKVRPIVDDGEIRNALDLLFDKTKADARKDWIGL